MSAVAFENPGDWDQVVVQSCNGKWFGKARKKGSASVPEKEFKATQHPYFTFTGHLETEKAARPALTLKIEAHNPMFS